MKPCAGLPPGAPCPTHEKGTWPQECYCYQEESKTMRDSSEKFLAYIFIIVTASVVIIGTWLLLDKAFGADVDQTCLTREQARAKYPKQYLYWHTEHHCWDNRPGRRPPEMHKPNHAANPGIPAPVEAPGPSIAYPTMMAGAGTVKEMMRPEAMTRWPLVLDFDDPPPVFETWQKRIIFEERK